jgi:hypothetical protein
MNVLHAPLRVKSAQLKYWLPTPVFSCVCLLGKNAPMFGEIKIEFGLQNYYYEPRFQYAGF